MIHRPLAVALLLLGTLSSSDALSGPKDTPDTKTLFGRQLTRERFEELARMYQQQKEAYSKLPDAMDEAFGVSAASKSWERLPRYSTLAAPLDVSPQQVQAALADGPALYMEGWFGKLKVRGDFSSIPNFTLASVRIAVKEVRDAKGRKIKFQQAPPEAQTIREDGEGSVELVTQPELEYSANLQGWKATAEVVFQVPVRFRKVSFSPSDVGKAKEGIRLVSWSDKQAGFEDDSGAIANAEVVLLSQEGRRLVSTGKSTRLPASEAALDKLMASRWEDLPASVDEPKGGPAQVTWRFGGKPAQLDLYLAEKPVERKLKMNVSAAPRYGAPKAPRANPPARALCPPLQAEALRKKVRIFGTRSEAMASHGEPEVAVQLPACDNSAFSKVEFVNLRFVDQAGKELPGDGLETQAIMLGDSYAHELRFSRKEAEDGERRDPAFRELAEVRGTVKLSFPRLRVVTLTRKATSEGALLLSPKPGEVKLRLPEALHAKLAQADSIPAAHLDVVTAYDAQGRLLPRPSSRTSSEQSQGGNVEQTESFVANPERVEVVIAEGEELLELPFAVKFPTPPEPRKER